MDLLDVLELQSCVWEGTTLCLGFTAECILYFYCYILERIYYFSLNNISFRSFVISLVDGIILLASYGRLPWCRTEKVIVVSQKLNEKFYRLNKKVNRDLFT